MGRIEYTLEAINQRLRESRVGVVVKQRGGRLSLVATLPAKPGKERPPHQQSIALGLPANEDGFRLAEQEARMLGSRIMLKQFDWSQYLGESKGNQSTAAYWIEQFKREYMATHTLSESSWRKHWWEVYKRLPPEKMLDSTVLLDLVLTTEPNSRNRKHTCQKLQKLADFAGLKTNLAKYQGNYGVSKVKDREIPGDEVIVQWWQRISNPQWRCVYGLMATFGLRDHEVFFCKFVANGLQVLEGKTGPRLVFAPLYPEWVETWELKALNLPDLRRDKGYDYLSGQTAQFFRRNKIPFVPYDLRHAYAIRASVKFRYPIGTAAALLGHSPEIHHRTYLKHLNQQQNLKVSQEILMHPDRPKPPDDLKDLI